MQKKICVCGQKKLIKIFTFNKRPRAEIKFEFTKNKKYYRELFKCRNCNHIISIHAMHDKNLYNGDYSKSNYEKKIFKTFKKINSLPSNKSDNFWRIKNLEKFSKKWFLKIKSSIKKINILDVGSGLCIFLNGIKKKFNWDCTALEIDKLLCSHAERIVGIKTLNINFLKMKNKKKFYIITLNKVIEHVRNPIAFVTSASKKLKKNGFIYIEVPDAENAATDKYGYEREEFTIDHPHVFSPTSLSIVISKSNLKLIHLERLVEPSGKYTLRAFAARTH